MQRHLAETDDSGFRVVYIYRVTTRHGSYLPEQLEILREWVKGRRRGSNNMHEYLYMLVVGWGSFVVCFGLSKLLKQVNRNF